MDDFVQTGWVTPMIECLRGQIDMLDALCSIVDREDRPDLERRIVSHRGLIEKLGVTPTMSKAVDA